MRTFGSHRKTWLGAVAMFVITLSACGGGGDSGGTSAQHYHITLRADRLSVPMDGSSPPDKSNVGLGGGYPHMTPLYVNATTDGMVVPGGTEFECSIVSGAGAGELYYLDDDPKHEEGGDGLPTRPKAYSSVVLRANSGSALFHFHALNLKGHSEIQCSVVDPRDRKRYSDRVTIEVY